tara:strand:+ start:1784 stop:2473 length:690 start_codon:yes stop_codon:yes gene_type:complete
MRYYLSISLIVVLFFVSCTSTNKITKSTAYKGMYDEQPLSILVMPPINRSTNIEAKEFFHATLNVPIANAGYYVIPPFLSMEILKRESAYDSELFLTQSLEKFNEIFDADIALFSIIHKWDKNTIGAKVKIDIEYILKSTTSNEVLYTRYGSIIYDASVSSGADGIYGLLADIALSAINTAATKYVDLARVCNSYTLSDLPKGKYSPLHNIDRDDYAGKKKFKKTLSSK